MVVCGLGYPVLARGCAGDAERTMTSNRLHPFRWAQQLLPSEKGVSSVDNPAYSGWGGSLKPHSVIALNRTIPWDVAQSGHVRTCGVVIFEHRDVTTKEGDILLYVTLQHHQPLAHLPCHIKRQEGGHSASNSDAVGDNNQLFFSSHGSVWFGVQAVCCVGAGTVQGGMDHTTNEYVQAAEGPRVGHLLPSAAHLAGVQYGFLVEFFITCEFFIS